MTYNVFGGTLNFAQSIKDTFESVFILYIQDTFREYLARHCALRAASYCDL